MNGQETLVQVAMMVDRTSMAARGHAAPANEVAGCSEAQNGVGQWEGAHDGEDDAEG